MPFKPNVTLIEQFPRAIRRKMEAADRIEGVFGTASPPVYIGPVPNGHSRNSFAAEAGLELEPKNWFKAGAAPNDRVCRDCLRR